MIQSFVPCKRTCEEEKLETQVIYVVFILRITFFMKYIRNSKFDQSEKPDPPGRL